MKGYLEAWQRLSSGAALVITERIGCYAIFESMVCIAGQPLAAQDVQEIVQEVTKPQSSQSEAEKAERRKAKKARQRAARAEAAAQRAEVRGLNRYSLICIVPWRQQRRF